METKEQYNKLVIDSLLRSHRRQDYPVPLLHRGRYFGEIAVELKAGELRNRGVIISDDSFQVRSCGNPVEDSDEFTDELMSSSIITRGQHRLSKEALFLALVHTASVSASTDSSIPAHKSIKSDTIAAAGASSSISPPPRPIRLITSRNGRNSSHHISSSRVSFQAPKRIPQPPSASSMTLAIRQDETSDKGGKSHPEHDIGPRQYPEVVEKKKHRYAPQKSASDTTSLNAADERISTRPLRSPLTNLNRDGLAPLRVILSSERRATSQAQITHSPKHPVVQANELAWWRFPKEHKFTSPKPHVPRGRIVGISSQDFDNDVSESDSSSECRKIPHDSTREENTVLPKRSDDQASFCTPSVQKSAWYDREHMQRRDEKSCSASSLSRDGLILNNEGPLTSQNIRFQDERPLPNHAWRYPREDSNMIKPTVLRERIIGISASNSDGDGSNDDNTCKKHTTGQQHLYSSSTEGRKHRTVSSHECMQGDNAWWRYPRQTARPVVPQERIVGIASTNALLEDGDVADNNAANTMEKHHTLVRQGLVLPEDHRSQSYNKRIVSSGARSNYFFRGDSKTYLSETVGIGSSYAFPSGSGSSRFESERASSPVGWKLLKKHSTNTDLNQNKFPVAKRSEMKQLRSDDTISSNDSGHQLSSGIIPSIATIDGRDEVSIGLVGRTTAHSRRRLPTHRLAVPQNNIGQQQSLRDKVIVSQDRIVGISYSSNIDSNSDSDDNSEGDNITTQKRKWLTRRGKNSNNSTTLSQRHKEYPIIRTSEVKRRQFIDQSIDRNMMIGRQCDDRLEYVKQQQSKLECSDNSWPVAPEDTTPTSPIISERNISTANTAASSSQDDDSCVSDSTECRTRNTPSVERLSGCGKSNGATALHGRITGMSSISLLSDGPFDGRPVVLPRRSAGDMLGGSDDSADEQDMNSINHPQLPSAIAWKNIFHKISPQRRRRLSKHRNSVSSPAVPCSMSRDIPNKYALDNCSSNTLQPVGKQRRWSKVKGNLMQLIHRPVIRSKSVSRNRRRKESYVKAQDAHHVERLETEQVTETLRAPKEDDLKSSNGSNTGEFDDVDHSSRTWASAFPRLSSFRTPRRLSKHRHLSTTNSKSTSTFSQPEGVMSVQSNRIVGFGTAIREDDAKPPDSTLDLLRRSATKLFRMNSQNETSGTKRIEDKSEGESASIVRSLFNRSFTVSHNKLSRGSNRDSAELPVKEYPHIVIPRNKNGSTTTSSFQRSKNSSNDHESIPEDHVIQFSMPNSKQHRNTHRINKEIPVTPTLSADFCNDVLLQPSEASGLRLRRDARHTLDVSAQIEQQPDQENAVRVPKLKLPCNINDYSSCPSESERYSDLSPLSPVVLPPRHTSEMLGGDESDSSSKDGSVSLPFGSQSITSPSKSRTSTRLSEICSDIVVSPERIVGFGSPAIVSLDSIGDTKKSKKLWWKPRLNRKHKNDIYGNKKRRSPQLSHGATNFVNDNSISCAIPSREVSSSPISSSDGKSDAQVSDASSAVSSITDAHHAEMKVKDTLAIPLPRLATILPKRRRLSKHRLPSQSPRTEGGYQKHEKQDSLWSTFFKRPKAKRRKNQEKVKSNRVTSIEKESRATRVDDRENTMSLAYLNDDYYSRPPVLPTRSSGDMLSNNEENDAQVSDVSSAVSNITDAHHAEMTVKNTLAIPLPRLASILPKRRRLSKHRLPSQSPRTRGGLQKHEKQDSLWSTFFKRPKAKRHKNQEKVKSNRLRSVPKESQDAKVDRENTMSLVNPAQFTAYLNDDYYSRPPVLPRRSADDMLSNNEESDAQVSDVSSAVSSITDAHADMKVKDTLAIPLPRLTSILPKRRRLSKHRLPSQSPRYRDDLQKQDSLWSTFFKRPKAKRHKNQEKVKSNRLRSVPKESQDARVDREHTMSLVNPAQFTAYLNDDYYSRPPVLPTRSADNMLSNDEDSITDASVDESLSPSCEVSAPGPLSRWQFALTSIFTRSSNDTNPPVSRRRDPTIIIRSSSLFTDTRISTNVTGKPAKVKKLWKKLRENLGQAMENARIEKYEVVKEKRREDAPVLQRSSKPFVLPPHNTQEMIGAAGDESKSDDDSSCDGGERSFISEQLAEDTKIKYSKPSKGRVLWNDLKLRWGLAMSQRKLNKAKKNKRRKQRAARCDIEAKSPDQMQATDKPCVLPACDDKSSDDGSYSDNDSRLSGDEQQDESARNREPSTGKILWNAFKKRWNEAMIKRPAKSKMQSRNEKRVKTNSSRAKEAPSTLRRSHIPFTAPSDSPDEMIDHGVDSEHSNDSSQSTCSTGVAHQSKRIQKPSRSKIFWNAVKLHWGKTLSKNHQSKRRKKKLARRKEGKPSETVNLSEMPQWSNKPVILPPRSSDDMLGNESDISDATSDSDMTSANERNAKKKSKWSWLMPLGPWQRSKKADSTLQESWQTNNFKRRRDPTIISRSTSGVADFRGESVSSDGTLPQKMPTQMGKITMNLKHHRNRLSLVSVPESKSDEDTSDDDMSNEHDEQLYENNSRNPSGKRRKLRLRRGIPAHNNTIPNSSTRRFQVWHNLRQYMRNDSSSGTAHRTLDKAMNKSMNRASRKNYSLKRKSSAVKGRTYHRPRLYIHRRPFVTQRLSGRLSASRRRSLSDVSADRQSEQNTAVTQLRALRLWNHAKLDFNNVHLPKWNMNWKLAYKTREKSDAEASNFDERRNSQRLLRNTLMLHALRKYHASNNVSNNNLIVELSQSPGLKAAKRRMMNDQRIDLLGTQDDIKSVTRIEESSEASEGLIVPHVADVANGTEDYNGSARGAVKSRARHRLSVYSGELPVSPSTNENFHRIYKTACKLHKETPCTAEENVTSNNTVQSKHFTTTSSSDWVAELAHSPGLLAAKRRMVDRRSDLLGALNEIKTSNDVEASSAVSDNGSHDGVLSVHSDSDILRKDISCRNSSTRIPKSKAKRRLSVYRGSLPTSPSSHENFRRMMKTALRVHESQSGIGTACTSIVVETPSTPIDDVHETDVVDCNSGLSRLMKMSTRRHTTTASGGSDDDSEDTKAPATSRSRHDILGVPSPRLVKMSARRRLSAHSSPATPSISKDKLKEYVSLKSAMGRSEALSVPNPTLQCTLALPVDNRSYLLGSADETDREYTPRGHHPEAMFSDDNSTGNESEFACSHCGYDMSSFAGAAADATFLLRTSAPSCGNKHCVHFAQHPRAAPSTPHKQSVIGPYQTFKAAHLNIVELL